MGNNYYLELPTTPCEKCGKPDIEESRIHIGKSSAGWVWLWHGYNATMSAPTALICTSQWFAYLMEKVSQGAEIVNEYGQKNSLEEFASTVIGKRGQNRRQAMQTGHEDISFTDFS